MIKIFNEKIDIKENHLLEIDYRLLPILLCDRTTGENLIWAIDNYCRLGEGYEVHCNMNIPLITGENENVIKPRIEKSTEEKNARIKNKAEVFTPSWVCNAQNNLIDDAWFEHKQKFNKEIEKDWKTLSAKIKFDSDKTWQDYIKDTRLELSCGEAPYLASRYDTVTGKFIEVKDRIGLLDRKLRIISENVEDEQEWIKWTEIALQNIYGFDWQGDNVLLARENLLYTVIDHFKEKFKKDVDVEHLIEFAEIISWNIWQMDGLKFVVPDSCATGEVKVEQLSFFEMEAPKKCPGCEKNNPWEHIGKYCKIMDWEENKAIKFIDLYKNKIF